MLERALPGISVRESLVRMGGNSRLYRTLLHSFGQRHLTVAIKRARHLALMPFVMSN